MGKATGKKSGKGFERLFRAALACLLAGMLCVPAVPAFAEDEPLPPAPQAAEEGEAAADEAAAAADEAAAPAAAPADPADAPAVATLNEAPASDALDEAAPQASVTPQSGSLSSTVSWQLDSSGKLRIFPRNGVSGSFGLTGEAPWHDALRAPVHSVVVEGRVSVVGSMAGLFKDCRYMESCDLGQLDASGATDASGLFQGCWYLESLDLSNLNLSSVSNATAMFKDDGSLKRLKLPRFGSSLSTTSWMFGGCHSLETLDLSTLDTSNVRDMSEMFNGCASLATLNLSPLNTSNVQNMSGMFERCEALTALDLAPLDTSRVQNMSRMLASCKGLTALDLSGLDVSQVVDMSYIFSHCTSLASLDLSPLNTLRVENMASMFFGCEAFVTLDASPLNTSRVEDMNSMFRGCRSLTSLNTASFDTTRVKNMQFIFEDCTSLTFLDISSFETMNCNIMSDLFLGCTSLRSVRVGQWFSFMSARGPGHSYAEGLPKYAGPAPDRGDGIARQFTGTWYLAERAQLDPATARVYAGDKVPATLRKAGWQNGPATWMAAEVAVVPPNARGAGELADGDHGVKWFVGDNGLLCIYATNGVYGAFSTEGFRPGWHAFNPTRCVVEAGTQVALAASADHLFEGCERITSFDLSKLDTSRATSMIGLFDDCESIVSLDLSMLDTARVENMASMFAGCKSLASVDLSTFDTARVRNMASMFNGCKSLVSVDLTPLNTSKVENMSSLFARCTSLTNPVLAAEDPASGKVVAIDTSQVTAMGYMFERCEKLRDLDLSMLDVSKVTAMQSLFAGCTALETVPLVPPAGALNVTKAYANCPNIARVPSEFTFGAVGSKAAGCFSVPSALLSGDEKVPTAYGGSDARLLAYDWAGSNRVLVRGAGAMGGLAAGGDGSVLGASVESGQAGASQVAAGKALASTGDGAGAVAGLALCAAALAAGCCALCSRRTRTRR